MTPPTTRALRDYVQHKEGCEAWCCDECNNTTQHHPGEVCSHGDGNHIFLSWPCTCGLDALLASLSTPPARTPDGGYDFAGEARRVCEAIGSGNGWMTVQCALREAYAAGAPQAAPAAQEPPCSHDFVPDDKTEDSRCSRCGVWHRTRGPAAQEPQQDETTIRDLVSRFLGDDEWRTVNREMATVFASAVLTAVHRTDPPAKTEGLRELVEQERDRLRAQSLTGHSDAYKLGYDCGLGDLYGAVVNRLTAAQASETSR